MDIRQENGVLGPKGLVWVSIKWHVLSRKWVIGKLMWLFVATNAYCFLKILNPKDIKMMNLQLHRIQDESSSCISAPMVFLTAPSWPEFTNTQVYSSQDFMRKPTVASLFHIVQHRCYGRLMRFKTSTLMNTEQIAFPWMPLMLNTMHAQVDIRK